MVWFGANAGLRVSEGLAVTVDRIEFLKRTLRVDRQLVGITDGRPRFGPPKTKASSATIPVAQSTLDRIAAHLAEHGAGVDGSSWRPTSAARSTGSGSTSSGRRP
jgi:integrase